MDLHLARLKALLSEHLSGPSGPVEAETVSDGQSNPTFRLRTGAVSYVLRRKPVGVLLKSANAVQREYHVQRALWPTDVPGRDFDAPTLPDQDIVTHHGGTGCVAVSDRALSTTGHPHAGLAGVDRVALGLWSDAGFIARYCERRGIAPIGHFNFYLAFIHLRMAAILQRVWKCAIEGNAADPARGFRLGAYVPDFATAGLAPLKEDI